MMNQSKTRLRGDAYACLATALHPNFTHQSHQSHQSHKYISVFGFVQLTLRSINYGTVYTGSQSQAVRFELIKRDCMQNTMGMIFLLDLKDTINIFVDILRFLDLHKGRQTSQ